MKNSRITACGRRINKASENMKDSEVQYGEVRWIVSVWESHY